MYAEYKYKKVHVHDQVFTGMYREHKLMMIYDTVTTIIIVHIHSGLCVVHTELNYPWRVGKLVHLVVGESFPV